MSVILARRVYESGLPPHLKQTLAPLALVYAQDDGTRIFPGVKLIAWWADKTERSVRNDLTALCRLGVLIPLSRSPAGSATSRLRHEWIDRRGGAHRTTHYRLDVSALPSRPPFQYGNPLPQPPAEKPEAQRVGVHEPGTPSLERRNPDADVSEADFRRSDRDQLENRKDADSRAQSSRAHDAGMYHLIAQLAAELLKHGEWEFDGRPCPITCQSELVHALNDECSRRGIDHATDPGVVHRAAALQWFKYRNPHLVKPKLGDERNEDSA